MGDELKEWFDTWRPKCPGCGATQFDVDDTQARCRSCRYRVDCIAEIWRFIPESRQDFYRPFLESYTRVRLAEGRGTFSETELKALPSCKSSHKLASQWRIRAASFRKLSRCLDRELKPGSRIIDVGAGTGWLSHRLAECGFRTCAVDISTDEHDGLGAAKAFAGEWPRIQGELDALPFSNGIADAVIFNASFHYCVEPAVALREALRVLRPRGMILIVDTPIYRDESSGRSMLEEQQRYFEQLIGSRSDSIRSSGFLTWRLLHTLAEVLGLQWKGDQPWYGLRWALRPIRARVLGQREPATFAIVRTYKPSSPSID